MAKVRPLVDDEALDLVKLRRVRGVGVDPIGAARADDADRRLLRQHGADLHRRGVGAQQHARAVFLRIEEERVVHLPRRMALWEIQLCKVVVVGLDVGTFGDGKAHVGKDSRQLIHHLAERMDAAGFRGRLAQRQRDVDGLGGQPCIERGRFQDIATRGQRLRNTVLGEVDGRALRLAFVGRHLAERRKQCRDRALLAEGRDPHRFKRGFVARGGDISEDLGFELSEVGHGNGHLLGAHLRSGKTRPSSSAKADDPVTPGVKM